MWLSHPLAKDRLKAALGTAALEALIGVALVFGIRASITRGPEEQLKLFDVVPEPPPPPPAIIPPPTRSSRPEGAAAPRNLRSKATDIAAPVPAVVLPAPPPIVAAPHPEQGTQSAQGAADIPGPGTGAGGLGNGTGGGGFGNGDGSGGHAARPPRLLKGKIKRSDWDFDDGDGVVWYSFWIEPDGRVDQCTVTHSTASPAMGRKVCMLIEQRYRFAPAVDASGRAMRYRGEGSQGWLAPEEEPPPQQR